MSPSAQPLARESHVATPASSTPYNPSPADASEVLTFLAQRPPHTVNIASLVRDNGLHTSKASTSRPSGAAKATACAASRN